MSITDTFLQLKGTEVVSRRGGGSLERYSSPYGTGKFAVSYGREKYNHLRTTVIKVTCIYFLSVISVVSLLKHLMF